MTTEPLPDTLPPLTDLEQVELDNGFTFGGGPTPTGTTINVLCRNPRCDRSGQHVALHPDTVQPIRCGGTITEPNGDTRPCSAVLHCDHATETTTERTGTIGAPVDVTRETCTRCGTVVNETTNPVAPTPIADLPATLLEQPAGPDGNTD